MDGSRDPSEVVHRIEEARPLRDGRLAYRPDLDGLRAIAILLVLASHAFWPMLNGAGAAGVTAFFVLSGYLITSILLAEQRVTGRIDLRGFYARRLRRLAPAFVVMLAVTGMLGVAGAWAVGWPDAWLSSVFYVGNWPIALGGPQGLTNHTWSLAIEEQFYLSWPLLIAALAPRRAAWVAITAIVVALIVRAGSSDLFGYYSTIGRLDGLAVGCVLAIAGIRLPRWIGVVGIAIVLVAAFGPGSLSFLTSVAIAGAALIVVSDAPIGWLAPLGRRAYSLYLWDLPIAMLFGFAPAATVLVFATAEASYRFVERPFLNRQLNDLHGKWRDGGRGVQRGRGTAVRSPLELEGVAGRG